MEIQNKPQAIGEILKTPVKSDYTRLLEAISEITGERNFGKIAKKIHPFPREWVWGWVYESRRKKNPRAYFHWFLKHAND